MIVLVTGGTGYLGRAIVQALAARGHEPVIFARRAADSGLPGRLISGDIRDARNVRDALRDVDAVCHAAALVSIWRRRPQDFDDVNVEGLRTMIAACRGRGIPRLIYTSSFLALPPSWQDVPITANDYQRTKVLAHGVAMRAIDDGAPLVVMMPGVVYGPGPRTEGNLVGRLIDDHLARRLPGIIGGERVWSYAWTDDVAHAHVTALERAAVGTQYVVGGENAPQMRIFEILRELTGRPLPRRIPFTLASIAGRLEEWRAQTFGHPPLVTRGAVEIFRHDWALNSARSEQELSYRITPLDRGIRAVVGDTR
jgi:NAD+-dependent farnesol dehydrogenase